MQKIILNMGTWMPTGATRPNLTLDCVPDMVAQGNYATLEPY